MTYNLATSDVPHGSFSFIPAGFDMYVLGFEEVGPFIPLVCDSKQKALSAELRSHFDDTYFVMTDKPMLGLKLFIAVKKEYEDDIWATNEYLIPTGADGSYGNKGGVAVSARVFDSKVLFVCAHFAAHDKEVRERNRNYEDIVNKITEYSNGVNPFDSHNFVIWVGDLNYRISKTYEDARRLACAGRFQQLLAADQLTREKLAMRVFNGFFEEEINFPPTYKFDKDSPIYDTSKKMRVPSYTDRILFYTKSRKTIEVSNYMAHMDVLVSDHRPVSANVKLTLVEKPDAVSSNEKHSVVCRI